MKTAFLFTITLALCVARAETVTGDWHGTLHAGAQELRLALHISSDPKGGLAATMDSIDQGGMGMPVTSITLSGSALKFELQNIGGSYEGKVNADSTKISGTWRQGGGELPLEFSRGAAEPEKKRTAKPSDIDGDWQGTLEAGGNALRLVLHIMNYEDGLAATMDSLDQNAMGLRATTITRKGNKLNFEMKGIGGSYEGTFDPQLTALTGTWSQGGNDMPLVLKRAAKR